MKKALMTGLLAVAMLCLASSDAQAQRRYSSGSSSSSSMGRSYSSGSKSSPSFGRSSVTQSSSKPSTSGPAATSPSGRKFSTGSPPVKAQPSTPAQPSNPKYSNGPPKTGPPAAANNQPSNSAKPSNKGWNPGLSAAAQKEQSRQKYESTRPAEAPKPTYRSSTGVEKKLDPQAPAVVTTRRYITHERYVTYEHRATVFYGPYYGHPIYYNDWYSPFLMGYLLSSSVSANERAYWVYCHRASGDMDDARYRELLAKDAELSARLRVLEQKNTPVDPNFVLPSMRDNPDLQYSQDFINATYNPQNVPPPNDGPHDYSGVGRFFFWFFVVILILAVVALFVWLMFVKEW
jgi:hypothetical protein